MTLQQIYDLAIDMGKAADQEEKKRLVSILKKLKKTTKNFLKKRKNTSTKRL